MRHEGSIGAVGRGQDAEWTRKPGTTGLDGARLRHGPATAETGSVTSAVGDLGAAPPATRSAARRAASGRARELAYRATIRAIDIAVASTALVLTAPLMLVIALAIRLDSPGPAIFRHRRIGVNRRRRDGGPYTGPERRTVDEFGTPFTLYKFRTMYADARQQFAELYAYEYTDEELYTLPIKVLVGPKRNLESIDEPIDFNAGRPQDPRVTRLGHLLRRTSLDELPNFWNVLKGDMHLVGPRPDITENIRYYTPDHMRKLDVKPGVTGFAQVQGRGILSFFETNELDVEYVDTRSLAVDLRILLKTIRALMTRRGAI